MHCPWGWAWQRPHICASLLAERFPVDVYLPADTARQMVANPVPPGVRLHPYPLWHPFFRDRFKALIDQYDVAWFTSPVGFSLARESVPDRVRVVYDCMDDFLAFQHVSENMVRHSRHYLDEVCLVERGDLLFASSQTLAARLAERYRPPASILVVNNAAASAGVPVPAPRGVRRKPRMRVSYIGTVARWVDFDLLLRALEAVPEADVHLIGPQDVKPPAHPRLRSHGPKPHDKAMAMMRAADLLVMPFVLNPLTEAVNPVKLYEYIHAGVPAVAVAYAESEPFEDYLYLYRSADEFVELVRRAATGRLPPKKDPAAAAAFLEANSWTQRGSQWHAALGSLLAWPPQRHKAPHLAYQREQLSRFVDHVDRLRQKLDKPRTARKPPSQ